MSRKMEGVQPGGRSGKGWAGKPMESSTVAEELLGNPLLKVSITSGSEPCLSDKPLALNTTVAPLTACLQLGPYFMH